MEFQAAFVTGGSGFIGGRLIERLVADGIRVRALARSDRSVAAVEALGAEAVRGDLSDVDGITAGAQGTDIAKARRELGYRPDKVRAEGLAELRAAGSR